VDINFFLVIAVLLWLILGVPTFILYGIGYMMAKIRIFRKINLTAIWASVWALAMGGLLWACLSGPEHLFPLIPIIGSGLPAGIVSARLKKGKALPFLPILGAFIFLTLFVFSEISLFHD
jgi:hypothetical protein